MTMETLYRKTFYSWDEEGTIFDVAKKGHPLKKERTRAVALCEGTWFFQAINTLRDGDMGKKGEDGVYERIWWGDDIGNSTAENVRPANRSEVELFLKHCSLDEEAREEGRVVVAIIYGEDQIDVLFKDSK